MKKKIKTMAETYGNSSSHLCCPNCGKCIDCEDCDCELKKEWIKQGLIKGERMTKKQINPENFDDGDTIVADDFKPMKIQTIEELEKEIKDNPAFEHIKEDIKRGFSNFYSNWIIGKHPDYLASAIAGHLHDYEIIQAKLEQTKAISDTNEDIYYRLLKEDFEPEQLLAIAMYFKKLKQAIIGDEEK